MAKKLYFYELDFNISKDKPMSLVVTDGEEELNALFEGECFTRECDSDITHVIHAVGQPIAFIIKDIDLEQSVKLPGDSY